MDLLDNYYCVEVRGFVLTTGGFKMRRAFESILVREVIGFAVISILGLVFWLFAGLFASVAGVTDFAATNIVITILILGVAALAITKNVNQAAGCVFVLLALGAIAFLGSTFFHFVFGGLATLSLYPLTHLWAFLLFSVILAIIGLMLSQENEVSSGDFTITARVEVIESEDDQS